MNTVHCKINFQKKKIIKLNKNKIKSNKFDKILLKTIF